MLIDPTKTIIYAAAITPHTTRPGLSVITLPSGKVASSPRPGVLEEKEPNFDGGAESAQITNGLATYWPDRVGDPWTFAVQMVDKLL